MDDYEINDVDEPAVKRWTNAQVAAIAVYTSYLVDGCNQSLDAIKDQSSFDNPSSSGHVGMVNDMAPLAMHIWQRVEESMDEGFPSVFEYDVVEELGSWICLPMIATVTGNAHPNALRQIVSFPNYEAGMDAWKGHFEMLFQDFLAQGLAS